MTRYLLMVLLLTGGVFNSWGQGQGSEMISVRNMQPIQFRYSTIEDVLKPEEINNAIELRVKVKGNPVNVFAQLVASDARFYETFNNKLALKLQTHDSYSARTQQEVVLSSVPMLLFSQPQVEHTEHFNFYYDAVMYPFTSFVNPGRYNFYITFTMTRP